MLREGTGHARIQTQVPLYEREKWAHSGTLEGPNKCSEIAPSPVLPSYSFFHPKEFTTVGCGQCHFRLCARPTVGSLALWIRNDTFSELSSSSNNLLCHEDYLGSWWPARSHRDGTTPPLELASRSVPMWSLPPSTLHPLLNRASPPLTPPQTSQPRV